MELEARGSGEEPKEVAAGERSAPGRPPERGGWTAGRVLLALLLLSFALHFTGIASEIGDLYVSDEGKYRVEARRILGGELFRPWFTYPHLLFYVDAAALWCADHLGPVVPALAKWGAGLTRPIDLDRLVLRWVGALFGALTVLPVFRAGERLGGRRAAVLGSLALLFSPIFLEVCHQNIADVPSAFFAALCFAQIAGLAVRESAKSYALAGLAAGLAAGSKYPAGFVAVGIVAVWIGWRVRQRRVRPGLLLLAGGVALAAFVATTPSLLLFPGMVFRGRGNDIMFGVRQYAGRGWTGVVRESNVVYYGGLLASNFGWLLLGLGAWGLALAARRRVGGNGLALAWTMAFPVVFLALMMRLNVAVLRNVLPVLPILAVLIGLGFDRSLAAIARGTSAGERPARSSALLANALVLVAFVAPAAASGALLVSFSRPTTRELAARWIDDHLQPGAAILSESYTPWLGRNRFAMTRERFLVRFPEEKLRSPETDYLMVADSAYGRFMGAEEDEDETEAETESARARYRKLFEELPLVIAFENGQFRLGPRILILANQPEAPEFVRRAVLDPPGSWRERSIQVESGVLHAAERGRVLFKLFMQPGSYSITARGDGLAGSGIELIPLRLNSSTRAQLAPNLRCEVEFAWREKYFLYVDIPKGGSLSRLEIEPLAKPSPDS